MANLRFHIRIGLLALLAVGNLCLAGMSAAQRYRAGDGSLLADQLAKLTAADGQPADWFGSAVCLSGDTAVVGAYRADVGGNEDQGAAYIFYQVGGGVWTQVAKLSTADGAALDAFGRSVSIDGDIVVVGAAGANIGGNVRQGAAYIFYRNESGPDGWGQVAKIVADDGQEGDEFGVAVHVDGDTIVAGASSAEVGSNADQGAAFVFNRNEGGPDAWGQVAKLVASDGAADDAFGQSVSASGDTVVVGSFLADIGANADQGAAYLYYRDSGGPGAWGQVAKVTAGDGGAGDSFGTAVPIDGDTLVVGAGRARVNGTNRQGAAYVFYRDEGGADAWGQAAKLVAADGSSADQLGVQASISGDRVVASAAGADIGDNVDQGAAYVFSRNAAGPGVWGQVAKLVAGDGAGYDSFGSAVAVSGNTVVSGAPQADVEENDDRGVAYVFSLPGEANTISLADADVTYRGEDAEDWAGYSVSPAGDVNGDGFDDILIGAPYAGPGEEKGAGKAYLILGRPRDDWQPDHIDLTEADASFAGEITHPDYWDMLGRQNFTAGDINGDGYDDFLISRWRYSPPTSVGKAYLFLGKPDIDWGWDHDVEDADASFLGESDMDFASWYVSTAGDVNADGYDDFLIAATGNEEGGGEQAGQVYLFLGRREVDWGLDYDVGQADASFIGEAADDRAGRSATTAGDVNGDGYDDFLIGAIGNNDGGEDAGKAYLFLGRGPLEWGMDTPITQADASFIGEAAGDEAGRRVSGAGDVDGDGYDDFLLGASRNDHGGEPNDDLGKAYLFLGRATADWGADVPVSTADATFLGEGEHDQAGRRVSGAGDVNHDGYADFLIGAPHSVRAGENAGTAYLLYGRPQADWGNDYPLWQADVVYVAESASDRAGYDFAAAGDIDGDGVDDFLTCGYRGDENGPNSGQAYVFLSDFGAPPGVPIPMSPLDGTFTSNPAITFTWEAGKGGDPVGYDLEIDGEVVSTTGTKYLAVLGVGVHTWRVRAYNETGISDFSNAWTLTVEEPAHNVYLPVVVFQD